MLNDNNNDYVYDDFDVYNECSVIQTNKSFQSDIIKSSNTNYENFDFRNNESVYDIDDTMLNNNDDDNMNNLILCNDDVLLNNNDLINHSHENDDDKYDNVDDDNTKGAMGSNHRPGNQMYLNKNNSTSYICSFITPPKTKLNKESHTITQGYDHYNKYNETYKLNMRGKYQDILDKISNNNLDYHFNQYIYVPKNNKTQAFGYKNLKETKKHPLNNKKNLPITNKNSKINRKEKLNSGDGISRTYKNDNGKESSSNDKRISRTQKNA